MWIKFLLLLFFFLSLVGVGCENLFFFSFDQVRIFVGALGWNNSNQQQDSLWIWEQTVSAVIEFITYWECLQWFSPWYLRALLSVAFCFDVYWVIRWLWSDNLLILKLLLSHCAIWSINVHCVLNDIIWFNGLCVFIFISSWAFHEDYMALAANNVVSRT